MRLHRTKKVYELLKKYVTKKYFIEKKISISAKIEDILVLSGEFKNFCCDTHIVNLN